MPDLITNNVYVSLPAAAKKIYKEMQEELFSTIDGNEVMAVSAAAASGKCRQIANGGIYIDDHTAQHIHDAKTEAVADLVEELSGQPVLVAYEFNHDKDRLLKAFPKAAVIGGGVSPKKTAAIVEAWNAGEIAVLLGHPAAMGHGLNLQASGGAIIWHSLTWDYEYYDQLNRRIWRQGNTCKKVVVHRIICRGTIDEAVLRALGKKRNTQNSLLDALKTYRREIGGW
jgi:SNF2 family DNA or RNA helicase